MKIIEIVKKAVPMLPHWIALPVIYVIGYYGFLDNFFKVVGFAVPINASAQYPLEVVYIAFCAFHYALEISRPLRKRYLTQLPLIGADGQPRMIVLSMIAAGVTGLVHLLVQAGPVSIRDERLVARTRHVFSMTESAFLGGLENLVAEERAKHDIYMRLIADSPDHLAALKSLRKAVEIENPLERAGFVGVVAGAEPSVTLMPRSVEIADLVRTNWSLLELGDEDDDWHAVATAREILVLYWRRIPTKDFFVVSVRVYGEGRFLQDTAPFWREGEFAGFGVSVGMNKEIRYTNEVDEFDARLRGQQSWASHGEIQSIPTKTGRRLIFQDTLRASVLDPLFLRLDVPQAWLRKISLPDLLLSAVRVLLMLCLLGLSIHWRAQEFQKKKREVQLARRTPQ